MDLDSETCEKTFIWPASFYSDALSILILDRGRKLPCHPLANENVY